MKNQKGIVWAPVLIMTGVVVVTGIASYLLIQAGNTNQTENSNVNVAVVNQSNSNTTENLNTNVTTNTSQVTNTNTSANTNSTVNTNTVVNTNTSITELKTYDGPFLVEIKHPAKYTLEKKTELNRRGSYEAWNIVPQSSTPSLKELQIFRRDTIESFNNRCANTDTPCFFGDYPTVERFDGFMEAMNTPNPQSYQDYQAITLGTETYLVKDIAAVGDSGKIREYNTTIGGVTLITLWVYMPDSTYDTQADALVRPWQVNYMGF